MFLLEKVLCSGRCTNLLPAELENTCWNRRETYGGKVHHGNREFKLLYFPCKFYIELYTRYHIHVLNPSTN